MGLGAKRYALQGWEAQVISPLPPGSDRDRRQHFHQDCFPSGWAGLQRRGSWGSPVQGLLGYSCTSLGQLLFRARKGAERGVRNLHSVTCPQPGDTGVSIPKAAVTDPENCVLPLTWRPESETKCGQHARARDSGSRVGSWPASPQPLPRLHRSSSLWVCILPLPTGTPVAGSKFHPKSRTVSRSLTDTGFFLHRLFPCSWGLGGG